MEAGNHDNPMVLKLEEYAIRESPHSSTATVPVDDRKLQWTLSNRINRGLDRQGKRSPSSRRMLSYHARASSKSSFASGVQTTGKVTVS